MTGLRRMPRFADGLPRTRAAIGYAEQMHAGQRRSDGTPFILHPLEVASLLYHARAPDHVIAAGVLHDLIEKAGVSASELRERFGAQISELVLAVSDDDQIRGYAARKAALRRRVAGAGDEALLLFAADKLSKLRELLRETQLDPETSLTARPVRESRARRLRQYQRSLAMLEEWLPGSPLIGDLRNELTVFLSQRSTPTGGRGDRTSPAVESVAAAVAAVGARTLVGSVDDPATVPRRRRGVRLTDRTA